MESKSKIGLGIAKAAVLPLLMAVASGCHQPTQVEAKSSTPVHLADVTLDSSSDDLRYSASVLPFAKRTCHSSPQGMSQKLNRSSAQMDGVET